MEQERLGLDTTMSDKPTYIAISLAERKGATLEMLMRRNIIKLEARSLGED